jgi:hypothetical protein
LDLSTIGITNPQKSIRKQRNQDKRHAEEDEEETLVPKKSKKNSEINNQQSNIKEKNSSKEHSNNSVFPPPLNHQPTHTIQDPQKIVSYSGVITGYLGDCILELDNQFHLYLTHYFCNNKGRGLREGTLINLYNVHPVFIGKKLQVRKLGICVEIKFVLGIWMLYL